ncbi:Uncharacterised protein [Vibrio cholerae]|nr:Uncharacterised protein [Vibrio cholerae]
MGCTQCGIRAAQQPRFDGRLCCHKTRNIAALLIKTRQQLSQLFSAPRLTLDHPRSMSQSMRLCRRHSGGIHMVACKLRQIITNVRITQHRRTC